MAAGFIAAFAPLTALLLALAALGVVGYGAGVLGGLFGGAAGGFGPEEATEAGGHGPTRRGRFGHGGAPGSGGSGANLGQPHWWTPERQKHIYDKLRAGGLSDMGAKGLIARWMYVEAAQGPGSVNPTSGAVGLAQWLGNRKYGITSSTSVDDQIAHVLRELDSTESAAGAILKNAKTKEEAATGASAFERAEGYNAGTKRDNFTDRTAKGIDRSSPSGSRTNART